VSPIFGLDAVEQRKSLYYQETNLGLPNKHFLSSVQIFFPSFCFDIVLILALHFQSDLSEKQRVEMGVRMSVGLTFL
jgi:hypothetical protein